MDELFQLQFILPTLLGGAHVDELEPSDTGIQIFTTSTSQSAPVPLV